MNKKSINEIIKKKYIINRLIGIFDTNDEFLLLERLLDSNISYVLSSRGMGPKCILILIDSLRNHNLKIKDCPDNIFDLKSAQNLYQRKIYNDWTNLYIKKPIVTGEETDFQINHRKMYDSI